MTRWPQDVTNNKFCDRHEVHLLFDLDPPSNMALLLVLIQPKLASGMLELIEGCQRVLMAQPSLTEAQCTVVSVFLQGLEGM